VGLIIRRKDRRKKKNVAVIFSAKQEKVEIQPRDPEGFKSKPRQTVKQLKSVGRPPTQGHKMPSSQREKSACSAGLQQKR